MKRTLLYLFVWVHLGGAFLPLKGQDFFKAQTNPQSSFGQKMARFPNGDFVIADATTDALLGKGDGEITLIRMDPCGTVEWSYAYTRPDEYMDLKDVLVNDQEEIFVFGSAYEALAERMYILKTDGQGEAMRFRLFHPNTVDNITYAMTIDESRLLAFGIILDWDTQTQGFTAVFDHNLIFQSGKLFSPIAKAGRAIFSQDDGIFIGSGNYLYDLDENGAINWSATLEQSNTTAPVAGPIEVPGGYLFEVIKNGFAAIFLLSDQQQIVWQSEKFESKGGPADIQLMADGTIRVAYNCNGNNGLSAPCFLDMNLDGTITAQYQLVSDYIFQSASTYFSLGPEDIMTILGNGDPRFNENLEVGDYLIQYPLNDLLGDCFHWEAFSNTQPNDFQVIVNPTNGATSDINFELVYSGEIKQTAINSPFADQCDPLAGLGLIQLDTTLECDGFWEVQLPSPDFLWEDNFPEPNRTLSESGIYRAKKPRMRQTNCF